MSGAPERIAVEVPARSYEVLVGPGLLERTAEHLPELPGAERAFIVCDPRVATLYLDRVLASFPLPGVPLNVPEGEEAKSLGTVEALYQQLAVQEAHREDVVVALGGGAVGDVAGFVAATYMRGVAFVQLPTTLTAQVDAAIGGKVAVNLTHVKNLVGAFHQPRAVLADVLALETLDDRAFRSGLAEVAKYGFALDPSILDLLEGSLPQVLARDPAVLAEVVARCVRAKAEVVASDERDTGRRAVLNYGHTLGHAMERTQGAHEMTHGEAVAAGMVFAARLALRRGLCDEALVTRHRRMLAALGLPHRDRVEDPDALIASLRMDKKYRGGLRFVLLEELGRAKLVEVQEAEVREALGGGG